MISMIVACDMNNVIGYENELPWHLPEDLKYFRRITTGKTVIMGRKTYESIGRPLPLRTNVVVSRNGFTTKDDVIVVNDLELYLKDAPEESDIFVIGGEGIYKQALPYTKRVYNTKILKMFNGDSFFPGLDEKWHCIDNGDVKESATGLRYRHRIYKRVD